MNKFMTVTEMRKNAFSVVEEAEKPGVRIVITRDGLPKVAMMSFEELEGWMETMEVMADPSLDADVRKAIKEKKEGKLHKDTIDYDTLKKQLKL